jgi:phosphoketolase
LSIIALKPKRRWAARQELFDEHGKFRDEFAALAPTGHRRMGSNPHANGGELLQPPTSMITPWECPTIPSVRRSFD